MTQTYSLAEVAAVYLPAEWTDGVRWLSRRIRAGEISAYKVGRSWRMTEDDVSEFVARRRNSPREPVMAPAVSAVTPRSIIDGLSERSRARLKTPRDVGK